jgi:CDGSH-type Zn-finger protein/uncharacterized Fe-S cluster protein YjdI
MGKIYTGKDDDRRYRGPDVDVTYNLGRCIHARECVRGLPGVFDTEKRPWIQPEKASGEKITEVVKRCPTGALHVIPKLDQPGEPVPATNTIYLEPDSYLRLVGNLQITGSNVALEGETRATLCRCGASKNKPFCDNTHREIDFRAPTPAPAAEPDQDDPDVPARGPLRITINPNGPIEVQGNYEIRSEDGELIERGPHTWLCRCGGSSNNPFCDSTHKRNGFQAP